MLTWAQFAVERPSLAEAGRELFYFFGVGLALLATVRKDGGPRVHPVCPLILDGRLLAFIIPSRKLNDLERDGRYALHSYPLPDNEDVFYVTGQALAVDDNNMRHEAEQAYLAERAGMTVDLREQSLVEFRIDSCLLTRTTGHGDPSPQHTVWRASPR